MSDPNSVGIPLPSHLRRQPGRAAVYEPLPPPPAGIPLPRHLQATPPEAAGKVLGAAPPATPDSVDLGGVSQARKIDCPFA